jgi:hypothetical protein
MNTVDTVIVELGGAINPAIFQPDWLAAQGLIEESDRLYAIEEGKHRVVVTGEFTGAQYPWVVIETTRQDCRISSVPATETPDRIRDVAAGIFERLADTPLDSLSIAYHRHAALRSSDWEQLTTTLAPLEPLEGIIDGARLESISYNAIRDHGELRLLIKPSHQEGFTAFMFVEDARVLSGGPHSAAHAVAVLHEQWDAIRLNAETLLSHFLSP